MKPKSRNRLFYPHFRYSCPCPDPSVLQQIGKGKFSTIRALDDGVTAAKVMRKRKVIQEEGMLQQILAEKENHQLCSHHANVLTLLGSCQDDWHLYMLYPRCKTNLFRLARDNPTVDSAFVRATIKQLSMALSFVHDMTVVHRDVKLENVLVDASGELKLADFGLSKKLRRRERTKTVCGTLQYMAPEVLAEKPYGHAVDWWSLGMLVHRMAKGSMAYDKGIDHGETLKNLMRRKDVLSGS